MLEKEKIFTQKYSIFFLTLLFLFIAIILIYFDVKYSNHKLIFAMLDVGQGDALFIESPNGTQILVDGGPPKKILNELRKLMSPFDKKIDAIIITNPDLDHIGGFLDVLKIYEVGKVFESGTFNSSKIYKNLKEEIKNKNIKNILAKRGMRLHIGGGAFIDILFPDRDVSFWNTNDGSIVARLIYGENSIILTGDMTKKTEKIILENNLKEELKSDILKVAHHGSRSSSGESFIKVISSTYALISSGKNNNYGHPHNDVLNILEKLNIKILRTDLLGTIILKCDKISLCEIK